MRAPAMHVVMRDSTIITGPVGAALAVVSTEDSFDAGCGNGIVVGGCVGG
jgi:hypothetical protein